MSLLEKSYTVTTLEDTVYFTVAQYQAPLMPLDASYWQPVVSFPILYLDPPIDIPDTSTFDFYDLDIVTHWFTVDAPNIFYSNQPFTEDYIYGGNLPGYEYIHRYVGTYRRRRFRSFVATQKNYGKANYIHLLKGYELDNRGIPSYPVIKPTQDKQVTINYYKENTLEPLALRSIDWMSYTINLLKGKDCVLPIDGCVLGTLYCDDQQILNQITSLPTATDYLGNNYYSWSDLLPSAISGLFIHWDTLWNSSIIPIEVPSNATAYHTITEIGRTLMVVGANNNHWENRSTPTSDINFDPAHPIFEITAKVINIHVREQEDGSYGDITMDSPRIIEIHKALNAQKWAMNPDDNTKPRIDDLGWRINRLCDLLGIRVKTDGKPDEVLVKKKIRTVIDKSTKLDKDKIGVGNFGDDGMVVKRINNRFNGEEIVSDQCVILHDVIQLIQEYQDQSNLALGIQESSAIEVTSGKNTARFDNQLQLLVELFNLVNTTTEMQRSTLISSLVGQGQTSEIIAGLGLPSVTKTIPITINKKTSQLPYKGISPHRSISQEVATCTANVGIVLGQLL